MGGTSVDDRLALALALAFRAADAAAASSFRQSCVGSLSPRACNAPAKAEQRMPLLKHRG